MAINQRKTWDCSSFLSPPGFEPSSSSRPKQALIVLNLPIERLDLLARIWCSTELRFCADGGANRLHDAFTTEKERLRYKPDLIKGDLDSLRPDVRAFYESHGVEISHDPDQYSTDLMKCISSLSDIESASSTTYDLILLGGLTGRLDQTTHTLSQLHKLRKVRNKIWVVSEDEVAWVLDTGEHFIPVDHSLLGPTCGVLPLGISSSVISTTGLEWDVDDWETSFNTQISTSNHLVQGKDVTVRTTEPVWWCCAIRS